MDNTTINTSLNRRQFLTATLAGTAIVAADVMGVTPDAPCGQPAY